MTFVPAINTVKVDHRMLIEGDYAQYSLYFRSSSLPNTTDVEALCEYLVAQWKAEAAPAISAGAGVTSLYVTDLTSDTAPTWTYTDGLPAGGNVNVESMPSSVALVMSLRTNGRGRSSRGRVYIPGVPESLVSANLATNAYTQMRTYLNEIVNASLEPWTLVVCSRYLDGAPRSMAYTQDVTSVINTSDSVGTQRRRIKR